MLFHVEIRLIKLLDPICPTNIMYELIFMMPYANIDCDCAIPNLVKIHCKFIKPSINTTLTNKLLYVVY